MPRAVDQGVLRYQRRPFDLAILHLCSPGAELYLSQ